MKDYSHLIPEGYEINDNDNDLVNDGDYFIYANNSLRKLSGYTGSKIKYIKEIGANAVLKKIEIPLTEEEKNNRLKNKAREFVDKHISNPTQGIYEKFEIAFCKGGNEGL